MSKKIFEFAVIYTPLQTKDQLERGEEPKAELLVPLTPILAASEAEARVVAARKIPETHADKIDQCEIAVRPF